MSGMCGIDQQQRTQIMNAIRPAPKARNVIAQAKRACRVRAVRPFYAGTSAGLGLRPHANHKPCKGGILRGARRFAGALIVFLLAGIATQSAIAEIGYDSLPTEIKQRLETVIPVIYWQSASPQQALTDIIEKVNAIAPSFAPLKISAPDAKPNLGGETFSPPAVRPGGALADRAVIPDQTVTASVCNVTARELVDYVCERCGLEIADFGEGAVNLVYAPRQNSVLTAKVEVPKSVRRECEEFASSSWLTGIGWKHALLLKCDVAPNLRVKWTENDTLLQIEGYPEDVWKVRRVVRAINYREQSKRPSLTDDERKFLRLLMEISKVQVKFPSSGLPLDALLQQVRDEARKQNVDLKIQISPLFAKQLPTKTVSVQGFRVAGPFNAAGNSDPDSTNNLGTGLMGALLNYGLDLALRNDTEFTLVPRALYHPPDISDEEMFTWEWKLSPAELEPLMKNDNDGDMSPIVRTPSIPGSIAIYSKSTSTLTVRNYWWNLMLLRHRIDSVEKDRDAAKRNARPLPLPRRK